MVKPLSRPRTAVERAATTTQAGDPVRSADAPAAPGRRAEPVAELVRRIEAEYAEMPGLSVTLPQAQRLWAVDRRTCETVFDRLIAGGVLRLTTKGRFIRI